MASVGSAIGGILGFLIGGMPGMSIGYMIGLWLDPAPAPDPPELGELGVNSYIRNMPLSIGYGQDLAYPGIIWLGKNSVEMENTGDNKAPSWAPAFKADFAGAVSEGTIEDYIEYFINDKSIKDLDENDGIHLVFTERLGEATQDIPQLMFDYLQNKTAPACQFKHTAYVVGSGKIGRQNSLPTISIETKLKLVEPNEMDANPIKVLYDFLTNKRYGCGLDSSVFDGSPYTSGSWKEETDFCDELVDNFQGGTEPRFRYSNIINNKIKGYDVILDILQTCRGYICYSDGKLKVRIGKNNETPVMYFAEFDEGTFLSLFGTTVDKIYADFSNYPTGYWNGDIGFLTLGNKRVNFVIVNQTSEYIELAESLDSIPEIGTEIYINKQNMTKDSFVWNSLKEKERNNRVRIEFSSRTDVFDDDKKPTGSHKYRIDVVETDDNNDINETNQIKEVTTKMSGIKRKSQAARMATFLLDSARNTEFTCNFQTDILGFLFTIGDIIGVSHKAPNFDKKLFRIIDIEELENLESKISLVEYIAANYHDYINSDISIIDDYDMKNIYEKPKNVERFSVVEDTLSQKIFLLFKRPDNDPYWYGVVGYVDDGSGWNSFITLGQYNTIIVPTPSVALNGNIDYNELNIPFDSTTLYLTFPDSGSFWIDNEEIYYSSIDDVNNVFLDCIRGYNNTVVESHTLGTYINLRQASTPYYAYEKEDINKTLQFKLVSKSVTGMMSIASSALTDSIEIVGYFFSPSKSSLTQLNSQKNNNILNDGEDAVITWYFVTEGINKGYGYIYGGGAGYGGGALDGIYMIVVEVYKTSDGSLLHTEEILDTDVDTYTYDHLTNESENSGVFEPNLTFKIYQVSFDMMYSAPFIIITNS